MYNTLVKGGGVLGDLGPPGKLIALWAVADISLVNSI